ASLAFSALAVAVLAVSSVIAGVLIVGRQPLIDLSGSLMPASRAATRVALAWASVLPPTLAFTALAVLCSVATRSSVAGLGLPVLAAFAMQIAALVDGPEGARRIAITSAFGAWHGLLSEPPFYTPLFDAVAVSLAYFPISIAVARRVLRRRDIGG